MSDDPRLVLLRVQLYTAMQTLKGDDLDEFWALIDEIKESEFLHPRTVGR